MIVKKIEIKNFQSHRHTVLELDNFSAFVGPSSSGKTVVERALSWVFYNDYDQSYPHVAGEPVSVALTLADGHRIIRMRLGDKNTAKIVPPGVDEEDVQPFKDFGDEIPGVFNLINVRPLTIGKVKLDLNFSRQDPDAKGQAKIFLLGESKPAKAQLLGRLYGAHVVNTMLRLMGRDKLDAGRRLKDLQKDADAAKARLADYADLDGHEAAVAAAEAALAAREALAGLRARARALRADFDAMAGRRWLTGFDFGTLRARIGVLGELLGVHRQVSLIRAAAAQVKDRRWLLAFDLTKTKNSLKKLTELKNLARVARANAAATAAQAGRDWLLKADLVATKVLVASLGALRAHQRALSILDAQAAALAASHALNADTGALRGRLALLDELKGHRRALLAGVAKLPVLTLERANLARKLYTAQEAYRGELFAGGKCPVCGTDCPEIDVTDVRTRLNRLTGAMK